MKIIYICNFDYKRDPNYKLLASIVLNKLYEFISRMQLHN